MAGALPSSNEQISQDITRRSGEKDHLNGATTGETRTTIYGAFLSSDEQASQEVPRRSECFGKRHLLVLMCSTGFSSLYAMRVTLSVAIVAMVNNTAIPHVNKSVSDVCEYPGDNSTESSQDGEFVWNEYEQGLILGSFYWGYAMTNMLGGRLGDSFGGKIVYGGGVFVTSALTLLIPVIANTKIISLLIVLRVVQGLGEGVTVPASVSLMAKWVPPLERSKMTAFVNAGSQFGTIIALPICGLLCQSTFLGGWPSTFYVFGIVGVLWFLTWMYLKLSIPWRHIFTSMPFWGIFVVHTTQNWGFYTLFSELPTYMKNMLHFNITQNSFISALPYILMWIVSIVAGLTADSLRNKGYLSTTTTRRIFNSIGSYGPMICIVLVGYAGCDKFKAIALLCGAVGLSGFMYSGFTNSHLDIAPNFAGTLMGLTNTVATIPAFLAPQVVGYLINGNETVTQWRLVFWITGIIYFVGNTFYIIFISGEKQHWNDLEVL
ncbi:hypothetical protein SK128_002996 [Halocaridina rubra]|uniref:Sialin n=1 Tax=Halocaridina rubra TaxID=373956 RepID=A0AAN8XFH1_HALRR